MPASPIGKTKGNTIKPIGQTSGTHFGTDDKVQPKGRSSQPTGKQILGRG